MEFRLPVPFGENAAIHGRHGWFVYSPRDTVVGRSLARYGEWSEGEVERFAQILRPGDVVVEAGANLGSHTVPIARLVGPTGRVVAFEPQAAVFAMLRATVAMNRLENVQLVPAAVGARAGSLQMPVYGVDQHANFGAARASTRPGRAVPVVALDAVVRTSRLRLIKADVEGMEADVLRGAVGLIARFRPVLYLEIEPRFSATPTTIRTALALGYRVYRHHVPYFNPRNFFGSTRVLWRRVASINALCLPRESSQDLAAGLAEVGPPASWEGPL